jgi:quercetin dioxygenase-like cupin family protein
VSIGISGTQVDDPRFSKRNARYVPAGAGETIWVAGDTYTIKADAENTDGQLMLIEATVPPGGGPSPHIHNDHVEAFYLISGQLEFLNGDQTFEAEAGSFFYVPRGTLHRFRNRGLHAVKMIFFFIPGGIEEAFRAAAQPARPGELPPANAALVLDPELQKRYGTEYFSDL